MNTIPTLSIDEIRALPDLGPWHVGLCPTHRPGGEHEGMGTQPPLCLAVRDENGGVVDRGNQGAYRLMAAAPALRATALELAAEVGRLKTERDALREEIAKAPNQMPIRLEWSKHPELPRTHLAAVVLGYRFVLARIYHGPSRVELELEQFQPDGMLSVVAHDKADAAAIITSLLALRGVTVPPLPDQVTP